MPVVVGLVGVAVSYAAVGAAATCVVVAVAVVTVEGGLAAIGASAVARTVTAIAVGLVTIGGAGGVSFCFRNVDKNSSKGERSESGGGESFEVHLFVEVVCFVLIYNNTSGGYNHQLVTVC